MQKRLFRMTAISFGAVAVVAGLNLVAAGPASAWPWSGTVNVKGSAGCANTGGIQTVDSRGSLDGQTFTSSSLTNGNQYQIKFTNVRSGRVPSGGGWAWITVSCSMGGYHQSWVEMYRPSWGDVITKNF